MKKPKKPKGRNMNTKKSSRKKKTEKIKERRNMRMDKCLERDFIKSKISERRGVDEEDQGEEESENG